MAGRNSDGGSGSGSGSSGAPVRKDLIVQPGIRDQKRMDAFLRQAEAEGVRIIYADPKGVKAASPGGAKKIKTMFASHDSDYVVAVQDDDHSKGGPARAKAKGTKAAPPAARVAISEARRGRRGRSRKIGMRFGISSNDDIEGVLQAASKHRLDFVIVDVKDWKIIPLENIIAKLHKINTRIIASARTPAEVRKMFSILDVGVDGVIFATSSISQVREALLYMGSKQFEMAAAKITEIKEVGDGERVCVDTASMLERGEGMLIGSRSNFMFLVHNESVGSSFTSPRPFRVNAGAVHCYTPAPDGTTKYLSEIETGAEILVLNTDGRARRAAVGRSKIERRPMLMIKAEAGGEAGGIIAQDAETIRFVRPGGALVSVTHLKKGDKVMVHVGRAAGRHFGMEVSDEYILEK